MDPNEPVMCKVGDFGLSQFSAPLQGDMLATWQWLPPGIFEFVLILESITSDNPAYNEKSDVYSYGIVMYEIVTGYFLKH